MSSLPPGTHRMSSPEKFSSRWIALLSLCGVAIGLGNVWRFPYMMGQYGGSAFLAAYLLFVVLLAVPALAGEWALGRTTGSGTVGAFHRCFGSRWGRATALLLIFSVTIANSYYTVVIAQVAFTAGFSVYPGFSADTRPTYDALLGDVWISFGCSVSVLGAGLYVLRRGLKHGIEVVSRWFVPFFGLSALLLAVLSLLQPGALGHLREFLRADFSQLGPTEYFAALGQACYSVGVGGTFMLTYGRFMRRDQRLLPIALSTSLLDTGAAMLATLILVPTILIYGLDLAAGPGLIFDVLPTLFEQLPASAFTGGVFLTALALMAFLSSLAGLEVTATGFHELVPRWSKRRILLWIAVIESGVMLVCCVRPATIGTLDMIFGSGMQVVGCGLAIAALTWALRRAVVQSELGTSVVARSVYHWLRWVVPGVLFTILCAYVVSLLP